MALAFANASFADDATYPDTFAVTTGVVPSRKVTVPVGAAVPAVAVTMLAFKVTGELTSAEYGPLPVVVVVACPFEPVVVVDVFEDTVE